MSKKDQAIEYAIKQEKAVKRFKSKSVEMPNGCIELNTFKYDKRDRYRAFNIWFVKDEASMKVTVKGHRFAYALEHGFDALPKSTKFNAKTLCLNHICGNPKCVNPKHLNIMSVADNGAYRGPHSQKITKKMINSKTCSRCKDIKTYADFYKRSSKSDGHDYYCKQCRDEYTKKNAYTGSTLCSVEGCTNHHYARTMCRNHYARYCYYKKS